MDSTAKNALRTVVREKLYRLVPAERETKSLVIRSRLAKLDIFQTAQKTDRLMIYLNFGNEVQTLPLIGGSSVIVPFCTGDEMIPLRIESPEDLELGRFGILEPKPVFREDAKRRVLPEQIDCVIVPGLAFDAACYRLGRGKGYYDRFLCRLPPQTVRIGLAFECQIIEKIPVQPWDIPVSLIITENRIIQ
jgi:5-formyltetrahydrofolate cyclo-ligase